MTAAGNHFPMASDYSEQSMCREGTETLAERKREEELKSYAVRRHDGSLCTQKQPETLARTATAVGSGTAVAPTCNSNYSSLGDGGVSGWGGGLGGGAHLAHFHCGALADVALKGQQQFEVGLLHPPCLNA